MTRSVCLWYRCNTSSLSYQSSPRVSQSHAIVMQKMIMGTMTRQKMTAIWVNKGRSSKDWWYCSVLYPSAVCWDDADWRSLSLIIIMITTNDMVCVVVRWASILLSFRLLYACNVESNMPVTWTQVAGRNRWVAVVTTIIFYTELQYRRKTWDLQRKTCSRRWNFEGGTCSFRNFVSFSKLCNVQEWKCIYCLISISKFQVLIIFAGCFLSYTVLCCTVLSWYTRKIQLYCEYNPVD